jgi:hypothetical protein
LAIASLILSILWLGGLGSLLAVILASVALSGIRRSQGQRLGLGLARAALTIGLIGLLGTAVLLSYVGIDHSAKTALAAPPVLSVPANPAALVQTTLKLSDFPKLAEYSAGWKPQVFIDTTVFGDVAIAGDFARCLNIHSTLLGGTGPGGRAMSPNFTSASYSVENLVAVEPSVATAMRVVQQTNRIKASSCITKQLDEGWRQFNEAGPEADNLVVSVRPLFLRRAGDQSTSFSFFFNNRVSANYIITFEDVVIIRQGQKDAMLTFFGIENPLEPKLEQTLDAAVDAHLRSLVLIHVRQENQLARVDHHSE